MKARVAGLAAALVVGAVGGNTLLGASHDATGGRPPLELELVASGFESPVEVTAAPGEPGRLYVVEQVGRIRVLDGGAVRPEPFADLTRVVRSKGEQGLLGLAFHPDYAHDRRLYVHYSDRAGDTRVVELRSDGRRVLPGPGRLVLAADQPYENHNGGKIAFGPDGRLYVGLGDGGGAFDPEGRARNPASLMGKLLRIDVDRPGARPEVVAYGLRNPWRFSFDRTTGHLYIGDVGQDRVEEVNAVPAGETRLLDFGWDVYEGRRRLERKERNGAGRLTWPIATYPHGDECSITGGAVYRGAALPELAGRFLFGDYCSGRIWTLSWNGRAARVPIRTERVRLAGLTAFGEDSEGEMLLASQIGTVYRLVRGG